MIDFVEIWSSFKALIMRGRVQGDCRGLKWVMRGQGGERKKSHWENHSGLFFFATMDDHDSKYSLPLFGWSENRGRDKT